MYICKWKLYPRIPPKTVNKSLLWGKEFGGLGNG